MCGRRRWRLPVCRLVPRLLHFAFFSRVLDFFEPVEPRLRLIPVRFDGALAGVVRGAARGAQLSVRWVAVVQKTLRAQSGEIRLFPGEECAEVDHHLVGECVHGWVL